MGYTVWLRLSQLVRRRIKAYWDVMGLCVGGDGRWQGGGGPNVCG